MLGLFKRYKAMCLTLTLLLLSGAAWAQTAPVPFTINKVSGSSNPAEYWSPQIDVTTSTSGQPIATLLSLISTTAAGQWVELNFNSVDLVKDQIVIGTETTTWNTQKGKGIRISGNVVSSANFVLAGEESKNGTILVNAAPATGCNVDGEIASGGTNPCTFKVTIAGTVRNSAAAGFAVVNNAGLLTVSGTVVNGIDNRNFSANSITLQGSPSISKFAPGNAARFGAINTRAGATATLAIAKKETGCTSTPFFTNTTDPTDPTADVAVTDCADFNGRDVPIMFNVANPDGTAAQNLSYTSVAIANGAYLATGSKANGYGFNIADRFTILNNLGHYDTRVYGIALNGNSVTTGSGATAVTKIVSFKNMNLLFEPDDARLGCIQARVVDIDGTNPTGRRILSKIDSIVYTPAVTGANATAEVCRFRAINQTQCSGKDMLFVASSPANADNAQCRAAKTTAECVTIKDNGGLDTEAAGVLLITKPVFNYNGLNSTVAPSLQGACRDEVAADRIRAAGFGDYEACNALEPTGNLTTTSDPTDDVAPYLAKKEQAKNCFIHFGYNYNYSRNSNTATNDPGVVVTTGKPTASKVTSDYLPTSASSSVTFVSPKAGTTSVTKILDLEGVGFKSRTTVIITVAGTTTGGTLTLKGKNLISSISGTTVSAQEDYTLIYPINSIADGVITIDAASPTPVSSSFAELMDEFIKGNGSTITPAIIKYANSQFTIEKVTNEGSTTPPNLERRETIVFASRGTATGTTAASAPAVQRNYDALLKAQCEAADKAVTDSDHEETRNFQFTGTYALWKANTVANNPSANTYNSDGVCRLLSTTEAELANAAGFAQYAGSGSRIFYPEMQFIRMVNHPITWELVPDTTDNNKGVLKIGADDTDTKYYEIRVGTRIDDNNTTTVADDDTITTVTITEKTLLSLISSSSVSQPSITFDVTDAQGTLTLDDTNVDCDSDAACEALQDLVNDGYLVIGFDGNVKSDNNGRFLGKLSLTYDSNGSTTGGTTTTVSYAATSRTDYSAACAGLNDSRYIMSNGEPTSDIDPSYIGDIAKWESNSCKQLSPLERCRSWKNVDGNVASFNPPGINTPATYASNTPYCKTSTDLCIDISGDKYWRQGQDYDTLGLTVAVDKDALAAHLSASSSNTIASYYALTAKSAYGEKWVARNPGTDISSVLEVPNRGTHCRLPENDKECKAIAAYINADRGLTGASVIALAYNPEYDWLSGVSRPEYNTVTRHTNGGCEASKESECSTKKEEFLANQNKCGYCIEGYEYSTWNGTANALTDFTAPNTSASSCKVKLDDTGALASGLDVEEASCKRVNKIWVGTDRKDEQGNLYYKLADDGIGIVNNKQNVCLDKCSPAFKLVNAKCEQKQRDDQWNKEMLAFNVRAQSDTWVKFWDATNGYVNAFDGITATSEAHKDSLRYSASSQVLTAEYDVGLMFFQHSVKISFANLLGNFAWQGSLPKITFIDGGTADTVVTDDIATTATGYDANNNNKVVTIARGDNNTDKKIVFTIPSSKIKTAGGKDSTIAGTITVNILADAARGATGMDVASNAVDFEGVGGFGNKVAAITRAANAFTVQPKASNTHVKVDISKADSGLVAKNTITNMTGRYKNDGEWVEIATADLTAKTFNIPVQDISKSTANKVVDIEITGTVPSDNNKPWALFKFTVTLGTVEAVKKADCNKGSVTGFAYPAGGFYEEDRKYAIGDIYQGATNPYAGSGICTQTSGSWTVTAVGGNCSGPLDDPRNLVEGGKCVAYLNCAPASSSNSNTTGGWDKVLKKQDNTCAQLARRDVVQDTVKADFDATTGANSDVNNWGEPGASAAGLAGSAIAKGIKATNVSTGFGDAAIRFVGGTSTQPDQVVIELAQSATSTSIDFRGLYAYLADVVTKPTQESKAVGRVKTPTSNGWNAWGTTDITNLSAYGISAGSSSDSKVRIQIKTAPDSLTSGTRTVTQWINNSSSSINYSSAEVVSNLIDTIEVVIQTTAAKARAACLSSASSGMIWNESRGPARHTSGANAGEIIIPVVIANSNPWCATAIDCELTDALNNPMPTGYSSNSSAYTLPADYWANHVAWTMTNKLTNNTSGTATNECVLITQSLANITADKLYGSQGPSGLLETPAVRSASSGTFLVNLAEGQDYARIDLSQYAAASYAGDKVVRYRSAVVNKDGSAPSWGIWGTTNTISPSSAPLALERYKLATKPDGTLEKEYLDVIYEFQVKTNSSEKTNHQMFTGTVTVKATAQNKAECAKPDRFTMPAVNPDGTETTVNVSGWWNNATSVCEQRKICDDKSIYYNPDYNGGWHTALDTLTNTCKPLTVISSRIVKDHIAITETDMTETGTTFANGTLRFEVPERTPNANPDISFLALVSGNIDSLQKSLFPENAKARIISYKVVANGADDDLEIREGQDGKKVITLDTVDLNLNNGFEFEFALKALEAEAADVVDNTGTTVTLQIKDGTNFAQFNITALITANRKTMCEDSNFKWINPSTCDITACKTGYLLTADNKCRKQEEAIYLSAKDLLLFRGKVSGSEGWHAISVDREKGKVAGFYNDDQGNCTVIDDLHAGLDCDKRGDYEVTLDYNQKGVAINFANMFKTLGIVETVEMSVDGVNFENISSLLVKDDDNKDAWADPNKAVDEKCKVGLAIPDACENGVKYYFVEKGELNAPKTVTFKFYIRGNSNLISVKLLPEKIYAASQLVGEDQFAFKANNVALAKDKVGFAAASNVFSLILDKDQNSIGVDFSKLIEEENINLDNLAIITESKYVATAAKENKDIVVIRWKGNKDLSWTEVTKKADVNTALFDKNKNSSAAFEIAANGNYYGATVKFELTKEELDAAECLASGKYWNATTKACEVKVVCTDRQDYVEPNTCVAKPAAELCVLDKGPGAQIVDGVCKSKSEIDSEIALRKVVCDAGFNVWNATTNTCDTSSCITGYIMQSGACRLDPGTPVLNSSLNVGLGLSLNGSNLSILGLTTAEKVSIVDVKGKELLSATVAPNETISLAKLPNGMYLVNVNGMSFKLVK